MPIVYLVGMPGAPASPERRMALAEDYPAYLASYADKSSVEASVEVLSHIESRPRRLLVDSGAFTAMNTGKLFDPREYARWALDFARGAGAGIEELRFINLDVIGDQAASDRNMAIIEAEGAEVLPVLTMGASLDDFDSLLTRYPYICLGGLARWRGARRVRPWLDRIFDRVVVFWRKSGRMPKLHALGLTKRWVFERYPLYSADSTSWFNPVRYGRPESAGIRGKRLPRRNQSSDPAIIAAHATVVRAEIRRARDVSQTATALWAKRGVIWDD